MLHLMRLSWKTGYRDEIEGTVIFIDDNGDWRGYNGKELIYYLWEDKVYCYNEIEGPKKAEELGFFSHMERE